MFSDLTEPRKGWHFWIYRLLIDINFARTWTWDDQTDDGMQRTTRFLSVHLVNRHYDKPLPKGGFVCVSQKALTIILGPLKIMFGLST